jgi:hypothetical protein
MSRFYTHYWKNETCDDYIRRGFEGSRAVYHARNTFLKKGVSPGDIVYSVSIVNGELLLISRLEVGTILPREAAATLLQVAPHQLFQATDYLIARAATTLRFGTIVPVEVTRQLRFVSGDDFVGLVFKDTDDSRLDTQTLRGVRELTERSASLLNQFHEPLVQIEQSDITKFRAISEWQL